MDASELTRVWKSLIQGPEKSWVLFANGTCVILMEPEGDLAAQAVALLREWGPVHAGSSFGDFNVIELEDDQGWAVTGHHQDILTYVGLEEGGGAGSSELIVGLLGRSKRGEDADQLQVIHVEDRRTQG